MTKQEGLRAVAIWDNMLARARELLSTIVQGPLPDSEAEIMIAAFCWMKEKSGVEVPGSSREAVEAQVRFVNELRAGNYDARCGCEDHHCKDHPTRHH